MLDSPRLHTGRNANRQAEAATPAALAASTAIGGPRRPPSLSSAVIWLVRCDGPAFMGPRRSGGRLPSSDLLCAGGRCRPQGRVRTGAGLRSRNRLRSRPPSAIRIVLMRSRTTAESSRSAWRLIAPKP